MAKKFSTLQEKMSPESRAIVEALTREMLTEIEQGKQRVASARQQPLANDVLVEQQKKTT